MITEQEYQSLLSFAKFYLRNKPHLSAEDLVNDVIVQIIENGEKYNAVVAEKRIKSHPDVRAKTIRKQGKEFSREIDKVCKGCKEVLPVAMFQIHNLPHTRVLSARCKECIKKQMSICKKTPKGRENNRKHLQTFIKKHPDRFAYQQAEYRKKQKRALTDAYIRKRLYHHYSNDFLLKPENYYIIEEFREREKKTQP